MKAVVVYQEVPPGAGPDEQDVLAEVAMVEASLRSLGHEPVSLPFSLQVGDLVRSLQELRPEFVFNLVESVAGLGQLIHFCPAVLAALGLPHTGSSTDAVYLTSNKILTKRWMTAAGIPTPPWIDLAELEAERALPFPGPYIVKPVWEDASFGLLDESVVADEAALLAGLEGHRKRLASRGPAFVEGYVEGREFNVSMMDDGSGPRVLPVAEIRFCGFRDGQPRIVGYQAKWDESSFEFHNTPRTFDFPESDSALLAELTELSLRCWRLVGLRGYGRVDFRVDAQGRPWVLEVNINPCLSPDAGFMAAAARAGLSQSRVVELIVAAALRPAAGRTRS